MKCPQCDKPLNEKGVCPHALPDCWKCGRIHHGIFSDGRLFHDDCPTCDKYKDRIT